MIRDLVNSENSLLHQKIKSCGVNLDRHFLAKTLIENMLYHNGVGLSANQIGIDERAFVMMRDVENNEILVCFNPKIVKSYSEEVEFEEGCLSYPDVFLNICRPDKIVIKYEDVDKKEHKMKLQGFASIVFKHELDHLDGIDFTER